LLSAKYNGPVLNKGHKNFRYDRMFQKLVVILHDENYWGISNGSYKTFVGDMSKAISKGRKISPKMFNAMNGIVKRYIGSTDPEKVQVRNKKIEAILTKLDVVKNALIEAKYAKITEGSGIMFLDSIAKQVERSAKLSVKQKDALNKMYLKAVKRAEKNKK